MAIVATALFVITACDKKDDDDSGGGKEESGVVTLTAPPYKVRPRLQLVLQTVSERSARTQW